MNPTKVPSLSRNQRRGATAVEFALTAPLLFLFTFAAWEFSRANMILNTIENAAYEGCRAGIVHGATASEVIDAAQEVLNSAFTRDTVITCTPSVITPTTTEVTVTIDAPLDQNAWISPFFLSGLTLRRSATLARERFEFVTAN